MKYKKVFLVCVVLWLTPVASYGGDKVATKVLQYYDVNLQAGIINSWGVYKVCIDGNSYLLTGNGGIVQMMHERGNEAIPVECKNE